MKNLGLLLVACLVLLVAGCSDESPSPVSSDDATPVAQAVPDKVQEVLSQFTLPDDALSPELQLIDPAEYPPDLSDTSWDVYAVTILWGRLYNACTDVAATTIWDGSLWANGEIVVHPVFPIAFENGQDSLIPYSVPYSASWGSRTAAMDFDGVSFLVFYKRGIFYFVEPKLTFDTYPFKLELSFGQLENFCAFYDVGNCNAVVVHSRKLKPYVCTRGTFSGEWVRDDATVGSGHFEGWWMDSNGDPIGLYNGRFWTNNDFTREYEGWVSGFYTDEVIATLKGTWWYDDMSLCPMCGEGHGKFMGRIFYHNSPDLANTHVGVMKGEFGWREDFTAVKYPMNGVWYLKCNCSLGTDFPHTD